MQNSFQTIMLETHKFKHKKSPAVTTDFSTELYVWFTCSAHSPCRSFILNKSKVETLPLFFKMINQMGTETERALHMW